MKNIVIITGTTRGLGKEFERIVSLNEDNYVVSINRTKIIRNKLNIRDITIDLSKINEKKIGNFKNIILLLLLGKDLNRIVFINNAFSVLPIDKIHKIDSKDIMSSLNTNVVSPILLMKEFIILTKDIPIKKEFINISSGASKYAIKDWSIYCLSKASIEMFMLSIKKEYENIFEVHSVDPGVLDTKMQSQIREHYPDEENYFTNLQKNGSLQNPKNVALKILQDFDLCL